VGEREDWIPSLKTNWDAIWAAQSIVGIPSFRDGTPLVALPPRPMQCIEREIFAVRVEEIEAGRVDRPPSQFDRLQFSVAAIENHLGYRRSTASRSRGIRWQCGSMANVRHLQ
jgi:hypothetical protein